MKTYLATLAFCLATSSAMAATTTINLDPYSGQNVTGQTIDGATIDNADVQTNPAGEASLISFFLDGNTPIKLDFVDDFVTSFMGNGSDYGQDEDTYWVEAYDSSNNLIDFDTITGPAGSFDEFMVSVTGNFIDYVLLYTTGQFPGAVFWSDLKYTTQTAVVPLPAAGLMLVAGLGGLAAMRRRKT